MNDTLQHLELKSITAKSNIRELNLPHVKQLSENMLENGVINPLTVRENGNKYILIAGFHRFAAAKKAELKSVPVKIVKNIDEKAASYISLSENIVRRDMSWPEQVAAVRLIKDSSELDSEELAKKLSIHKSTAADMALISELPQAYVEKGINNPPLRTEFRRYARLPDDRRADLLKNIIEIAKNNDDKYPGAPKLEKAIDRLEVGLVNACFDTSECQTCPKNTACQSSMFADTDVADGLCRDSACYDKKTGKAMLLAAEAAHKGSGVPKEQRITLDEGVSYEDGFTHNEISFRAWNPDELGEAASGCADCKDRSVAVQRMTTRCDAHVVCGNSKCYEELLPKESEQSNSDTSNSSETPSKSKASKKVLAIKPELKADSKSVAAYRRKITENTVTISVQDTKDAGALLRCITVMLSKDAQNSNFRGQELELDKTASLNSKEIQDIFRAHILHNIVNMNGNTLLSVYEVIAGKDFLCESESVMNDDFLHTLTRSELLGIIHEAGAEKEKGKDAWKLLLKAQKGALVEEVMKYDFDTKFLPASLIPSKEHSLNKAL